MSASDYGRRYWRVQSARLGPIYLYADFVEVIDGALFFRRTLDCEVLTNLVIAAGGWEDVSAASIIDDGAVAVEHWDEP